MAWPTAPARSRQFGQGFSDGNQTVSFALHWALFSHVPQTQGEFYHALRKRKGNHASIEMITPKTQLTFYKILLDAKFGTGEENRWRIERSLVWTGAVFVA